MLNYIWLGLVVAAVLLGGLNGRLDEVTKGAFEMAGTAATIALGLVGIMALWLGVMRLAEKSGLIAILSKALSPVMRRIFPEVPADHPAMGSILMNISANMLGLANAATPLGLRAMKDLERLNPHPGVATNAMCTFLAINTSSVQLIPATAVAILASAKSANPTSIVGTAFVATLCSTIAALIAVKFFQRLKIFAIPANEPVRDRTAELEKDEADVVMPVAPKPLSLVPAVALLGFVVLCAYFFLLALWFPQGTAVNDPGYVRLVNALSVVAIPFVLGFFPLYAMLRGVPVYEEFTEGAKEGFTTAVRIIPYLAAILVAIGMFRSAGGIELLTGAVGPYLEAVFFPPELLPMAVMRPLSGGGSMGIFTELVATHGPDSLIALMAATVFGSTETTFYVVTVYFGAVAVRKTRHAIAAGLVADFAGLVAAVTICNLVFGTSAS